MAPDVLGCAAKAELDTSKNAATSTVIRHNDLVFFFASPFELRILQSSGLNAR
jgi:hypothetical protein